MCLRVLKGCFLLISLIDGKKYIVETEGKISDIHIIHNGISVRSFNLGDSRDMTVETEISRLETNTSSSGDYSFSHEDCSLRQSGPLSLVQLLHYCDLIGRGPTLLCSHWSRASLVMLAPAVLCHKEPARASKAPY